MMKKALYLLVLFPVLVFGQTENFVKTTTYKVATTDGITDIDGNPVTDAKKTISVTYFDGLGRPVQQIANKQSNTGKNIITHMEYDEFGRQVKEYLPYVGLDGTVNFSTTAEMDVNDFYANPTLSRTGNPNFEATGNPYNEKEIELSPLNRVYRQAAPGNDWLMGNGHEMKMDYQTNEANEVKCYKATATWNATTALYNISLVNAAGNVFYDELQLYKTVIKNENWKTSDNKNNTTEEFKDKEGRMVLKKTYTNNTAYETYYVYDQYGNLTYVIPPAVTNVTAQLNSLCYQYKYDYRNRVGAKKLPGKQWEYIVYNTLDKPVATGPVFTPWGGTTQGWMMTKYDPFGRVAYTGFYSGVEATTEAGRKAYADNYTASSAGQYEGRDIGKVLDGIAVWHGNKIYPMTGYKVLTINYYDDYNFPRLTAPLSGLIETQKPALSVKGQSTGSWVRFLDSATNTVGESSYVLYDDLKYVPIRNYMTNHLGGFTQVDNKIDFTTKSLYSITTHKRIASSTVLTLRDDYTYSDQERMLTHLHTINSDTPELIAQNSYDELGQLIGKNVGRTIASPLQKVNYNYNIRGWLKGINDVDNLGSNPTDLFAFRLNYNDPQSGGGTALYNGNISETFWRTNSDNIQRKYKYSYDNLNRLLEANYSKPGVSVTDSYREKLVYDKGGNITTLQRNGNLDSNSAFVNQIDFLTYSYNGNRLMKVLDSTNSPQGFDDDSILGAIDLTDDYSYDINGNMTKDENKGITAITYNHLNLPTFINFGLNKIEYQYNAAGQKLQKKVTEYGFTGSTITTTEYLNGFQYRNNVLLFFPHAEGYVNNTVVSGVNKYNYVYNYTDHLGNIRMSYAFDTPSTSLKILEENHYYPFGLKQTNYNVDRRIFVEISATVTLRTTTPTDITPYEYKYNGKEYQDELSLNLYDYGARNYDPAIGRWMNIDPLAEMSRRFSPYTYALNNPVYFIDVDGMFADMGGHDANDSSRETRPTYGGGHWSDDIRGINPDEESKDNSSFENTTEGSGDSESNETTNTSANDDPPTIWEKLMKLFKWKSGSDEEIDENNENREIFFKRTDKAIEIGQAYITVVLEVGTLPFGGPGKVQATKLALKGFTKHGLNRIIERGIKPQQILEALRKGAQTIRTIKNQKQLMVVYKDVTLIISTEGRNAGKIITAY